MIFVRDQERSLSFYLDQLRFRLIVDHHVAGIGWIEVVPPDGTANIALAQAMPDSVALLVAQSGLRRLVGRSVITNEVICEGNAGIRVQPYSHYTHE